MSSFLFILGAAFWVLFGLACLGAVIGIGYGFLGHGIGGGLIAIGTSAIILPSLFAGAAFSHANVETGEGSETGYITAVQVKGAIWPTPDLFFKTDTNNSETYRYCLPPGDTELFEQAQELAKSRTFVRIHYDQRAWWHPWQCNNGPMVKSFEVLA